MREQDAAWAAGLFEGEGSISIVSRGASKRSPQSRGWILQCRVSMTDETPPRLFLGWFGGAFRERAPIRATWKGSYIWEVKSLDAAAFLREILPHIRTDRVREKAELGISFQEQKRYGTQNDKEYLARQDAFKARLTDLNRRGVAA